MNKLIKIAFFAVCAIALSCPFLVGQDETKIPPVQNEMRDLNLLKDDLGVFSQDPFSAQQKPTAEKLELRLYPIRYVDVAELTDVLTRALTNTSGSPRIVPNESQNSLIVSGTSDQLDKANKLIELMDTKTAEQRGNQFVLKIFSLVNADVEQCFRVVQTILGGEGNLRLDFDAKTRKIFAYGTQDTCTLIEGLLERMDEIDTPSPGPQRNVYLSMTLVVEGAQLQSDNANQLADPNQRVRDLIRKTKEKGLVSFQSPKVAANTVTRVRCRKIEGLMTRSPRRSNRVTPSGGFFQNGSESRIGGFQLQSQGYLTQLDNGLFHLDSAVNVETIVGKETKARAEMNSEIEAPMDHPVLLTFSTIGGIDAAVIISIDSVE